MSAMGVGRGRTVAWGAGLLALIVGPALAQSPSPAASPEVKIDRSRFSGTWKLNPEQSEKLSDKMRDRGGDRRGPGGPGGGGHSGPGGGWGGGPGGGHGGPGGGWGGGPGGGRGGGGQGERGGPPEGSRGSMRRLAEPSQSLTIKLEGEEFMIADDTGEIRYLHPDGRSIKKDDGTTEVRTRWKGDALVTETIPSRGPRLKETFTLSPEGRQLFVTVHFEPPSGAAVDVRRVYDAGNEP